MDNRRRNTAILFIAAGLFFLLGKTFGFMAVSAVILLLLGIYKIRTDGDAKGYIILVISALMLLGNHLSILVAIILISLGYFFIKSRQLHGSDSYIQNQTILESIRWDKEPWEVKNMSRWSILSEVRIDFSLALQDEEEALIMLQGVAGDVDLIVPLDCGLAIESNVLLGRIAIGDDKDAGSLNKRYWQSANYEQSSHRVKLIVSYLVGDIEVKMV